MSDLWSKLSPRAKQIVAVVGGLVAVYLVVSGRRNPTPATPAPAEDLPTQTGPPAEDAVIGAGDLSNNFTEIFNRLQDLTGHVQALEATPTATPGATTPRAVGGQPPVALNGKKDPQLGKRRTTVQKVPKGDPETVGDVARRVYTSSRYFKYIMFCNADWLGQGTNVDTRLPLGHSVRY